MAGCDVGAIASANIVLENTGKALLVDENVRKVYLGEE